MKVTDRKAARWKLLRSRWVTLAEFRQLVPGYAIRTLKRWAKDGKLPVSRRGGRTYWVDMRALREMRTRGLEDVFSTALEDDDESSVSINATDEEHELSDLTGVPVETIHRWGAGMYRANGYYGYVWFASFAEGHEMGFATDPVERLALRPGRLLLGCVPGTLMTGRHIRQALGLVGTSGKVEATDDVLALIDLANRVAPKMHVRKTRMREKDERMDGFWDASQASKLGQKGQRRIVD